MGTDSDPLRAAIGSRLKACLEALDVSQRALAREVGCTGAYISQIATGKSPLNYKLAAHLSDNYGLSLDWLFTGEGKMFSSGGVAESTSIYATGEASTEELLDELHRRIEAAEQSQGERMLAFTDDENQFDRWEGEERFRALPYMRDEAAAGTGRVVEDQVEGYVVVHERIARSGGRLVCVRIAGDSMAPTLPDGSIVAVQISDADPRDQVGRIVAARTDDGDVTIKRLAAAKHCLVLRADNPSYDLIEVDPTVQPHPLIGPVVWAWIDLS